MNTSLQYEVYNTKYSKDGNTSSASTDISIKKEDCADIIVTVYTNSAFGNRLHTYISATKPRLWGTRPLIIADTISKCTMARVKSQHNACLQTDTLLTHIVKYLNQTTLTGEML